MMKKINLFIVDDNESYLKRLNKYLSNNYKEKLEISCFTDIELFMEAVESKKNKDILLIDSELYNSTLCNIGIKSILFLVGDEQILEDRVCIHKYRDISKIYEIVINSYLEGNVDDIKKIYSNNVDTKVIAVYSPIGGSGKSTIAAALCTNLAEQKKEVFYLNLEDIQSTSLYFQGEKITSLSDIIFEIKDRSESFMQKLLTTINIDKESGVSFLDPTDNILDIEEMTNEDVKWLLEGLLETKKYNYIVIDMTSKFNTLYKMILNSTNKIVMPILNNITSNNKIEKFINDINFINKIIFIYNRCNNTNPDNIECLDSLNIKIKWVIKEDYMVGDNNPKKAIKSSIIRESINAIIEQINIEEE